MHLSLPKLKQLSLAKLSLLLLLVVLVCWGAIPGYLSGGNWRWTSPPRVTVLKQLKQLRQDGLTLTEWQTDDRRVSIIGEHRWLQQTISEKRNPDRAIDSSQTSSPINSSPTKATIFLFPQNGPLDQPAVEWTDLDGVQGWKTDSTRTAEFITSKSPAQVTARFFRAWTDRQTYAVLQWYAWSGGGHPMPSHWFVADRIAQWSDRRVPWVAVSLLMPIEPLDDIEKSWSKLESLAQTVQITLMEGALKENAG
ncbi:MAG: cyanoexosortase B system-associated protein [Myxacorys chilensis ATA2-1-KO14]|jgi:cyanoexosortase B-associated protein|nr:cyanoexosortase B system-associated protein [Myxacorys chilensis ATA2-1-KO14]